MSTPEQNIATDNTQVATTNNQTPANTPGSNHAQSSGMQTTPVMQTTQNMGA